MANHKVQPESRTCPIDGTVFEVGGRGRRPRKTVYCSTACLNIYRQSLNPHTGSHAPRPRKNMDTLHNEAWLRAKYLDERLATTDIAKMLECSAPSVLWALRKFGIPSRDKSDAKKGRPSTTEWTPEMRESMAAPRRGVNWHPDPRIADVRNARARRTGITGPRYDAMLEAQSGVCLVCGQPETAVGRGGGLRTLCVDHDHVTGAIRGLLCRNCNVALGIVHDSIPTLRSMIAYLERHAP